VGLNGSVSVDSAEYDSARRGDHVVVRYLSCCPLFPRLAAHRTGDVVRELARELLAAPFLAWLVASLVAFVIAARLGAVVVIAVALASLWAGLTLLFPATPLVVPTGIETDARVARATLVRESPRRGGGGRRHSAIGTAARRLRMPYEVVELRFLPAGAPDSVLAVDAVDADSAGTRTWGSVVRVRYNPRAPREAWLVEGTRTFRARNRWHHLFLVLFIVGASTGAGLAWRLRRRRLSVAG
jgi:hypothetical protein